VCGGGGNNLAEMERAGVGCLQRGKITQNFCQFSEKFSPKYNRSGTVRTVTESVNLNILPEIRINFTNDKVMCESQTDTGKNTK
jgi:hypothetical protein